MSDSEELIASIEQLEEFGRHEADGATPSPALRGVLAEVATTGVIRYPWCSLRPLVAQLLEEAICQYESEELSSGPLAPLPGGESPDMVVRRFRLLLLQMPNAPWTLQRLAELLLGPRRQYTRLHKLVLALEKLLLVSGECPVTPDPPPRPRLADLRPVNVHPGPGSSNAAAAGGEEPPPKRQRTDAETGAGLLAAALEVRGAGPAAAGGPGPTGDASSSGGGAAAAAAAGAGGSGSPAAMEVDAGAAAGGGPPAADAGAASDVGPSVPTQAANGPLQEHQPQAVGQQQQQQGGSSSRGPGRPPDTEAPLEGSRGHGGSGDAMEGVEVAVAAAAPQQTVPL